MRVALITPTWKTENPYPPLGLAYIGAVLEKHGHDVKIMDLTLYPNNVDKKIQDIVDFSPDIVGVSCMSHNYGNALTIAKDIRNKTCAFIIFGGPHATIMPEDVLNNYFIDFVIIGEGENTFLKLCEKLQEKIKNFDIDGLKNILEDVDGLGYKERLIGDNKVNINPRTCYIKNLDDIPMPARHLLDLNKYSLKDDFGNKMITIVSSRGCPYRCTYCYKGLFGTTYRQRSPENIMDEIKYCVSHYGYKSFYFIDDLFTMNMGRIEKLTDAIIKENLNIKWQCLARVNNATLEMFQLMKKAGCYKVHFGIESGNQDIINRAKKGITLDQVRNAVRYCKQAGIKAKGYFMLGMSGDTVRTMQDTIDFADELSLDEMMFSITTPFPGTELWNIIDKEKIKSLSNAFYYSLDSDDISIFYNVSEASDEEILSMVIKSQKIVDSTRTRNYCNKKFGKGVGTLAWQLSKVDIIKRIGKNIMRIS